MTNLSHPFRKKWGQNFLRDPNTITKIVNCLQPRQSDNILEIGPGDGALTRHLSNQSKQIHAVEIDPLLITQLEKNNYPNVTIHKRDILEWDLNQLKGEVKIIGNLPYYISSPILFKLLAWQNWERMILMFQKELAQRIVSNHGNKSYGRISVMCQVYCEVKIEFIVSKNVFHPKPDVDSAVLTFYPKDKELPEFNNFSNLVKQAFSQRRKKLKNNLPEAYKSGKIEKWANSRPEEISPNGFIQIYNLIFVG
ncbi:MAG: ribosomal RNA small subunit methyltransferase A [Candidatus Marinimicrobia bacterium]|nr:ribosomal RNA small subunit methyltransferase A [Candidatus Neomarinimicrobiota bacterium]